VWHVKHIDPVSTKPERDADLMIPDRVVFGNVYQCELVSQGTKLGKMPVGTKQEIVIFSVDIGQVADQVPDMVSDPKLVNSPNVDRDTHGFP